MPVYSGTFAQMLFELLEERYNRQEAQFETQCSEPLIKISGEVS